MFITQRQNILMEKDVVTKKGVFKLSGKKLKTKSEVISQENGSGSDQVDHGFNKFQSIFWPIHSYELKKFLPMSLLMFCILFVYSMAKDLKDVFIQTYATCGGPQLLSVLKLFFVMPFAVLAVMIFTTLINKFGKEKTFYIIISFFVVFYAIFGFLIFPNISVLHASEEQVNYLRSRLPGFMYNIIPCITNWSYTLFYIVSEIWGTMAISSLFWQFANQITKKTEVKRFFGLFSLIGNIGVIISGSSLKAMSRVKDEAVFDAHVKVLMASIVLFGLLTMLIYTYINKVVMKDKRFQNSDEVKVKKEKEKVGTMQGIKILFHSKYLLLISVMVIGFGLCSNFLEVLLKEKMLELMPSKHAYASMTSNLTIAIGVFSIVAVLLSANILRRCKWRTSALFTPMVLFIMGGTFFGLVMWGEFMGKTIFGMNVLTLSVVFGIIADASSKSSKFSLFDTTKSMAYIPLDEDTKTKGQAAVEVIAGRLGKAGASSVQYVLMNLVSIGSKLSSHLFVVVPVFLTMVLGWIASVVKLSDKYEKAIGKNELLQ